MIEINLIPDVKQEFIRAKRVRTVVVSGAILVGVVSIGLVVLLAVYLFGVQAVRSNIADEQIKQKSQELANIEDIEDTLTIQHQLTRLGELHNQKSIASRFFSILAAINPSEPNAVSFTVARYESEAQTIHLEGQASNGYTAAEVLKKTILSTTLSYQDGDGGSQTVNLTDNVSTSELSYGEDSTGKKILNFSMEFTYDSSLFDRGSLNAVIVRPNRQIVTDSYLRLPESLFSGDVSDDGGENNG